MKKNKNILFEEIGNEIPFSVPENYFDEFALKIEKQIKEKQAPVRHFIRPWMYIAATFIGIFVIGQVFYTVNQNKATVTADNYESYVLSQVDETALMDYYVDNQ